jgi:hydrogenase expression/formation protein HypE
MNERLKLGMKSKLKSDVAALNPLTTQLFDRKLKIHFMRDPTRGGVASALNEAADRARWGIMLEEKNVPVKNEVHGASEMLGLDPLYIANEGKFIAVVEKKSCDGILKIIRSHPLGKNAAVIGEIVKRPRGVWLRTRIGGTRPLLQLEAEGLPRIC